MNINDRLASELGHTLIRALIAEAQLEALTEKLKEKESDQKEESVKKNDNLTRPDQP